MEMATRRREQEVWQACDDLWALKGSLNAITGDAIREQLLTLGKKKGSPNEIYKYKKTWVKSRGIGPSEDLSEALLGEGANDPISRAVSLVHEQLKNEAQNHLDDICAQHEQQLSQKDQELDKQKIQLDEVVKELSVLHDQLDEERHKKFQTQKKLDAECDIRMAVERELAVVKNNLDHAQKSHGQLMSELKNAHENQIGQLVKNAGEQNNQYQNQVKSLQQKLQDQGAELSELINQEKVKNYTLKAQVEHQQKLSAQAQSSTRELEKQLAITSNVVSEAKIKIAEQKETIRHLAGALENDQKQNTDINAQLKQCRLKHKQRAAQVARLRALLQRTTA